MYTVILAHVMFSIAYVVTVVMARLRTMDASLEEAAARSCATEWQAFYRVTLPALDSSESPARPAGVHQFLRRLLITSLVAGVDPRPCRW